MQTVKDLTGIAATPTRQEAIAYQPRPELVTPPASAALPQPGNGTTVVASNWPDDPDALAQQVKIDAAVREAAGVDPVFTLPSRPPVDPYAGLSEEEREAIAIELYKQAKAGVAVDANGNPVRRYLIDPPVEYMAGDPSAPVAVVEEQGTGWKWPWQWFSGSS
jgi:hypothetical protein